MSLLEPDKADHPSKRLLCTTSTLYGRRGWIGRWVAWQGTQYPEGWKARLRQTPLLMSIVPETHLPILCMVPVLARSLLFLSPPLPSPWLSADCHHHHGYVCFCFCSTLSRSQSWGREASLIRLPVELGSLKVSSGLLSVCSGPSRFFEGLEKMGLT